MLKFFCVNGGIPGTIVGDEIDDVLSEEYAIQDIHKRMEYRIPTLGIPSLCLWFHGQCEFVKKLVFLLSFFESYTHENISIKIRTYFKETRYRI